ncbi:TlpA family protein disulfide reductase [Pedobacter sp. HDW13]|uniref:TlpA family protein disulfide reductase n=1 Tax=Pedobacter sp. HDW13 TaxID=2714940 RepID=UPI001407AD3C|nr:TlpA disulfide reductase family protein [Pedobacter sp. HDW13]QIL40456.1 TlpA family protein disulfide reductase [Pedobacter sp. HDW13]
MLPSEKVKQLLFILLLFVISFHSSAQNKSVKSNHIRISFNGKKFDRLNLITTVEGNIKRSFSGYSKDGMAWDFAYPDSLYEQIRYFDINNKNDADTSANTITLSTITGADTVLCGSCHFSRGDVALNASFLKINTYTGMRFLKKNGTEGSRTELENQFFIGQVKDRQLLSSMEGIKIRYSYFYKVSGTYEESLKKYITLTQKYPDSYGLVAGLAGRLNYYKSTDDVAAVFNLFSPKIKASYYGKEIARNLAFNHFDNAMLKPWNSDTPEAIVTDPNKPSLVVFSASWCVPCHKQLPIVKELKQNLGDQLDVVYISIDDKNTLANWKKMTEAAEIPGRSLLAIDQMEQIRKKYFVQTIPYSFLVYPGGKLEVINVSIEADKQKIYKFINKGSK